MVPENIPLSHEIIHQIVKETHPDREWSEFEIKRLTSDLNQTLFRYADSNKLLCEPTPQQLRKQISVLRKALRGLKLVFPPREQNSLRNYLIHLGEDYATFGVRIPTWSRATWGACFPPETHGR